MLTREQELVELYSRFSYKNVDQHISELWTVLSEYISSYASGTEYYVCDPADSSRCVMKLEKTPDNVIQLISLSDAFLNIDFKFYIHDIQYQMNSKGEIIFCLESETLARSSLFTDNQYTIFDGFQMLKIPTYICIAIIKDQMIIKLSLDENYGIINPNATILSNLIDGSPLGEKLILLCHHYPIDEGYLRDDPVKMKKGTFAKQRQFGPYTEWNVQINSRTEMVII